MKRPPSSPRPDPGREAIAAARLVVVKFGSRVLVDAAGRLALPRLRRIAAQLAAWRKATGASIVVVSSGAIACGLNAIHIRRRPTDLPSLQMAAAVGQQRLIAAWKDAFHRQHLQTGQVLLTHDDLQSRDRYLNAHATLLKLLETGIVPVINENDAVATDEIRFGDNDALASRTAMLLGADLLLLLTTVDGFLAPASSSAPPRRIPLLPAVTPADLQQATGKGSPYSTGGMASKLASAAEAAATGTAVIIASGLSSTALPALAAGRDVGTLIPPAPRAPHVLTPLRRWVRYFHRPRGTVFIDPGAARALASGKSSLLLVGVRDVDGDFAPGDLVEIRALPAAPGAPAPLLATGLAQYPASAVRLLRGCNTFQVRRQLGPDAPDELVHLDYLVLEKDQP